VQEGKCICGKTSEFILTCSNNNRLGGMVGVIVTQPLDVLKTRLQSSAKVESIQQGHYNTSAATNSIWNFKTLNSLKYTFKNEGYAGLFRGLIPNLMGVVPSRAIYFSSYNATKTFLENMAAGDDPDKIATELKHSHPVIHILSAASAGIVVPTIMNPMFLVKTRIQLEDGRKTSGTPGYTGYSDCVNRIYREEGIRGFYKGLTASFLGIAETAIYFVIYERAKIMSNQWKHARSGLSEEEFLKQKSFSIPEMMALSGGCKLMASALTYPHEVVRTRMRERVDGVTRYNGLMSTFVTIYREEGYKGLYKGMGAHMIRVVPNAAIMFLTYEGVVWLARKQQE
jgi:solute carrier family 25 protein 33/36